MSDIKDFVIENGVLKKYVGKDKSVCIPDGVTEIGEKAFWRKSIESVIMPDSVTVIRAEAFLYCYDLQKVVFSEQIVEIGQKAFADCQSLKKISLSESLKKIGEYAFDGCVNLETAIIPETIEEFGENAFRCCYQLKNQGSFFIFKNVLYHYVGELSCVDIPYGVEEIRGLSVYGNKATELIIPPSVSTIPKGSFGLMRSMRNCTILCKTDPQWADYLVKYAFNFYALAITYLSNNLTANDEFEKALIKQLSLRKNYIELIRRFVRMKDSELLGKLLQYVKKVSLEDLEEYIKLADDPACRAVLISYKDKLYSKQDVEKFISDKQEKELGLQDKSLADYRKEFKITKKGDRYVISGFKTDDIIKAIGCNEEYNDIITVPAKINGIPVDMGERVFQNCPYVRTVIIEDGIEKIGAFSFAGCRKLTDIYVPASVSDLGKYGTAFYCEPKQLQFTIHAPAGSYAETYAKENNIPFVAES